MNRLSSSNTIPTILISTTLFSFTFALADNDQAKPSVSRKLLASIEKTVDTLKKNPECLDDIDRVVEQTQKEVVHFSKEVKKILSPEQCKKLGDAIKQEVNNAGKIVETALDTCSANIDRAVDVTVSQDQKATLVQKVDEGVANIAATCNDKQTKAHFDKLGKELADAGKSFEESVKPAVEPITQELDSPKDN